MRLWPMDQTGHPTGDAARVHKGLVGICPQEGRTPYFTRHK